MLFTIKLNQMEFKAYHGCYELEKKVGNRFEVNVEFDARLEGAARADNVTKTVNYVTVYNIVQEQMLQASDIVENVALRIAETLKKEFKLIERVRVSVAKLAPPIGGKVRDVAVVIEL